jgi:peptidoglycan/xylan/chitin deacetylase (PgdA/CDA1 family)
MQPAIVTTSWDDGHPLDARLADLLAAHGLRGTFYVPLAAGGRPVVRGPGVRAMRALGMEIGSHSMTHRALTRLTPEAALAELVQSKDALEQWTGWPVASFCYPLGRWNRELARLARTAGYQLARTTVAFRDGKGLDPYRMPVSFQLFPHSRAVHVRHALREGNVGGLLHWLGRLGGERRLPELAAAMLRQVREEGGLLHIWGHSWEIEEHDLWGTLETVCRAIGRVRGVRYATNHEALALLGVIGG